MLHRAALAVMDLTVFRQLIAACPDWQDEQQGQRKNPTQAAHAGT